MTARNILVLTLVAWSAGCAAHLTPAAKRQQAEQRMKDAPEEAIPVLEELMSDRPDDLDLARLWVEAHVRAKKGQELLRRLDSQSGATAHYMRGLALAASPEAGGAAAEKELSLAVAAAPKVAEYRYRLGLALLEAKKTDEALSQLSEAVRLSPERAAFYLPLATAQWAKKDREGAIRSLRAFVSKAPSVQEVEKARAIMDRIADPFAALPASSEAKLDKALSLLREADRPADAALELEELTRSHPDVAVLHALLGLCHLKLDEGGRAMEEFRQAIEMDPLDGTNHYYLAEVYLARQRTNQAKEALRQAVELHPLLDLAYERLGNLELEDREFSAAKEHFQILTYLNPISADARMKLAASMQLLGDDASAQREIERVLSSDPQNVEAMLQLGLFHAKRGDVPEARRWLNQVLEKQPENALASRTLRELEGK
jgi:tetratricopeptide (TPR) repeat protein